MNLRKKNQLTQLAEQQQAKKKPRFPIEFNNVIELAYGYMPEILEELGHDFEEVGDEIHIINPNRADGDFGSFKFNGISELWSDFATGDTGKGSISLVKYLEEIDTLAAAKLILEILNGDDPEPTAPKAKPQAAANEPSFVKKPKLKLVKPAEPETVICPVPSDAPAVPESFYKLGKPSNWYVYRSATGEVLCYILRFDLPDGKKDFRHLTLHRTESGGTEWQMKGLNAPRPLFNLDQIALFPEKAIIIGEGEKAANALSVLFPQFVATTTMGGAQGASKADLSPLRGKEVFIWADHDDAGKKYAESIVQILRRHEPNTKISVLNQLTVSCGTDGNGNPVLNPGFKAEKGDDAADALQQGWTPAHAELLLRKGHFVEPLVKKMAQYFRGPKNVFKLDSDGVFLEKRDKEGETYFTWLSTWIKVIATARNLEDSAWGVVVEYAKPNGILAKEFLTFLDLQAAGQAALNTLSHLGVNRSSVAEHRTLLTEYLTNLPKDEHDRVLIARTTSKSGWVGPTTFVTPLQVIGNSDQEWVYTGPASSKNIYDSKGTLDDWKTNVASKCVGNSRLILSMCVALSGPLQHVLGAENGGVHLRGSSSIGKSVALSAALSVWSPPSGLLSWRTTDNSLEGAALARNDTLLTLDEMSQASPNVVGPIAYMIGNGQGKGRASSNMSFKAIDRFRCQVISTGEISLEAHMAAGGQTAMAGQEVRFLDIPADAGAGNGLFENVPGAYKANSFAEDIRKNAGLFYGTAGMAMVETLCCELEKSSNEMIATLKQLQQEFIQTHVPEGVGGQIYRVADRFSMYATAGELAIRAGILPWPEGEAHRGVAVCFKSWLENRGGNESLEKMKALTQIREFLERWGTSRFAPWQNPMYDTVTRINDQAGFYKTGLLNDGNTFYVNPEVFRTELCRGFDRKQVLQWLTEEGWLEIGDDGKPYVTERVPEIGTKRMYKLLPCAYGHVEMTTIPLAAVDQAEIAKTTEAARSKYTI